MLNKEYLKGSQQLCRRAIKRYNEVIVKFTEHAKSLNDAKSRCNDLLNTTEDIINSIAQTPKKINDGLIIIRKYTEDYRSLLKRFKEYDNKSLERDKKIVGGALVLAGSSLVAPSALMAIATTFGTSSTGTAIAVLHGAAATKAAVAWIGGGALSVGGGGMAAGTAVLTLTGPVLLATGGILIIAGTSYKFLKNKEEGDNVRNMARRLSIKAYEIGRQDAIIVAKTKEIETYWKKFEIVVNYAQKYKGSKYMDLNEEDQNKLVNLVNEAVICSEYVKWRIES